MVMERGQKGESKAKEESEAKEQRKGVQSIHIYLGAV